MRDLKSDLEICNKATPGPWYTQNEPINSAFFDVIAAAGIGIAPTGSQKNAEFIAAARTGWPETIERAIEAEELLASHAPEGHNVTNQQYQKLREENAQLRELNEKLSDDLVKIIEKCAPEHEELQGYKEENDLQRDSIQKLSAQVADLQKLNKQLLEYIAPIDGCDCEGCIEAKDVIEKYGLPNPGADLLAKIAKLEAGTRLIETDMGVCYQDFAWKCDNCSEVWTLVEGTPEDNLYKYCPNCGAKIIEYVPYIEGPADE